MRQDLPSVPGTPSFIPIVSEAIPAAMVQRAASAAPGIEVKLAGAVVRISSGVDDAAQLTAVLRAVRASASRSEDAEAEKRDPELRLDNAAKRRASRGALPAHLPRIEVTLTPEDTACPCCRASMTVIGEDSSERLDVIPAQFRVIVTRRPKLACRACTGIVVQAPAPARLIEGGIPTEAMVAHVLVARYADHLPLYRKCCSQHLR